MWSLTKVIGLVILPLMIGSAVMGSLQTMTTASVNPQYDAMDAILERENNRLYIDQNATESAIENDFYTSNQPGTEMFRDVIAVSQLSALSCTRAGDLISGRMYVAQVGVNELSSGDFENSDNAGIPVFAPDAIKSRLSGDAQNTNKAKWKVTPYYAFPGRPISYPFIERAPNYALQFTEFTPRCVGVQRAESALPDAGVLNDPVGYVIGGTAETIVSAPFDVWDSVTCKTVPAWIKRAGNDMEGRYGRVPFKLSEDLEQPIILGTDTKALMGGGEDQGITRDMVWQANFVNEEKQESGTCWLGAGVGAVASTGVGLTTGAATTVATGGNLAAGGLVGVAAGSTVATSYSWGSADVKLSPMLSGAEWSRYAPYDIEVIEGDSNWPGINLHYGHVVVDAPVVMDNHDELYIESGGSKGADERGYRFQRRAKYVLCPGTSGYIQTNREDGGRSGGEHIPTDEGKMKDSKITTYIHVTGGNPYSCVQNGGNYVVMDDRVRIEYFTDINVQED